jgi:O-antigen ligase
MFTFQGQGMTPTASGEYTAYPDSSTVDLVSTSSEPRPRAVRHPASAELYKPFHYLLLVYLFLYCSRIPELFPYAHIGMILQPILLIGMIMTGRVKAILRMPLGKVLIAFAVWVMICIPFSVWRGGSFVIFLVVLQALALVAFMAAFIRTIPDCLRVMYTVALAMAAVGILSLVVGGGKLHDTTRLGLGGGTDTLADANFLCLYIMIGLPFLWLSASLKTGFNKALLLSLMVPMLAGAARTGSRSGLLTLVAGLLLYLIFASVKQRLIVIAGGVVLLILAVFFLPQKTRERFTTYFQANSAQSVEAAESAESRKRMLIRSLELTAEHPLFGVGPGEFMDAEAAEAKEVGQRGMWHYTHNSYTEISSETGITGLVLFVIAFFGAYRGLSPVRNKYPDVRVRRAALFTQMAVIMTAVGAFFLSIAYGGIITAVIAISATFQAAIANKARQARLQTSENAL